MCVTRFPAHTDCKQARLWAQPPWGHNSNNIPCIFFTHTHTNLFTLLPLQPSCVCLPVPVRPRKTTALGLCVPVCVLVCVQEREKRQMNGAQINSPQTDLIQLLIIAYRERKPCCQREKRDTKTIGDRFSQFGFKITCLLTMSVDKWDAVLPWLGQ